MTQKTTKNLCTLRNIESFGTLNVLSQVLFRSQTPLRLCSYLSEAYLILNELTWIYYQKIYQIYLQLQRDPLWLT